MITFQNQIFLNGGLVGVNTILNMFRSDKHIGTLMPSPIYVFIVDWLGRGGGENSV